MNSFELKPLHRALFAILPVWMLTDHFARAMQFCGAVVIIYCLTMLFVKCLYMFRDRAFFDGLVVFWMSFILWVGNYFFYWDPKMIMSLFFLLPLSFEKGGRFQFFNFEDLNFSSISNQSLWFLILLAYLVLLQTLLGNGAFAWLPYASGLFIGLAFFCWIYQWVDLLKKNQEMFNE